MSAPAPVAARVRSQALFDTQTFLRNGEQLMVSIALPVMALVAATLLPYPDLGPAPRVDVLAPGVLALAVLSSAFTGQAIQTGFDRRYGVLRLLGVSPLGRGGLVAARTVAVLAVQVIQFAVLGAVAFALGWRPAALGIVPFVPFWLLGTACFVSFALLFAGTLRAEATLATSNLLWVVMAGLGGVVLPASNYPAPWDAIVSYLPCAALGDGFRAATETGSIAVVPLLVLAAWTLVFGFAASRLFRWSD